ncbi:hypothetical protein ACFVZD_47540 [Streptomyces sp. NPDC058287]|uniref:hypothetical protein n=1 Tax=Streptomyces sp. NPDC058287 TaxID=3346423 RepID=UPI0036E9A450
MVADQAQQRVRGRGVVVVGSFEQRLGGLEGVFWVVHVLAVDQGEQVTTSNLELADRDSNPVGRGRTFLTGRHAEAPVGTPADTPADRRRRRAGGTVPSGPTGAEDGTAEAIELTLTRYVGSIRLLRPVGQSP